MKFLILLFYKIKILNKNKNPSRLLAVIWLLLRTHSICGCLWCSRIWFVTGRGFWVAAGTGRSQWDRVQGPKLVAPCPLPRVKLNHSSHICVWPQQQLTPNKDVCPRASVPSFCCGFVTYLWWVIDWLPTWLRTVSTQLIWQRPKAPRQMKMTSQEPGQRLNLFGGKVQLLRTHCPHLKISKNVQKNPFQPQVSFCLWGSFWKTSRVGIGGQENQPGKQRVGFSAPRWPPGRGEGLEVEIKHWNQSCLGLKPPP